MKRKAGFFWIDQVEIQRINGATPHIFNNRNVKTPDVYAKIFK